MGCCVSSVPELGPESPPGADPEPTLGDIHRTLLVLVINTAQKELHQVSGGELDRAENASKLLKVTRDMIDHDPAAKGLTIREFKCSFPGFLFQPDDTLGFMRDISDEIRHGGRRLSRRIGDEMEDILLGQLAERRRLALIACLPGSLLRDAREYRLDSDANVLHSC